MPPEPIPSNPDVHRAAGDVRSAISDGLVALLCLLRGGFTRVEQTLLEGPRSAREASSAGIR